MLGKIINLLIISLLISTSSRSGEFKKLPNEMIILILDQLPKEEFRDILHLCHSSKELYEMREFIFPYLVLKISKFSFPIFTDLPTEEGLKFNVIKELIDNRNNNRFFDTKLDECNVILPEEEMKNIDSPCMCSIISITKKGKLYAWGKNTLGELGLGHFTDTPTPTLIKGALEGKKVISGCSFGHKIMALTSDGIVYVWGTNGSYQLGLGHSKAVNKPTPLLEPLKEKKVISIGCGHKHALALTLNGELYVWGKIKKGQLGLSHSEKFIIPTLLLGIFENERVISIKSIRMGTLVITSKFNIYMLGNVIPLINGPKLLNKDLDGKIITFIGGSFHLLALGTEGDVYACGFNEHGQLGLGEQVCLAKEFTLIKDAFNGQKIKRIYAKKNSSAALTVSGEIYVWGENNNGELELSHKDNVFVPTRQQKLLSE